jgi:hypothetical protein
MNRSGLSRGISRRSFAGKTGATIAAAAMAARLPIPYYAYAQEEEETPADRVPEGDRSIVLGFFSSFSGLLFDAFGKIAADY